MLTIGRASHYVVREVLLKQYMQISLIFKLKELIVLLKKNTYTVSELSEIIKISKGTIYAAIRRGEIPHVRIGRRIVIPLRVVENMLLCSYDCGQEPCRETQEVQ
jgi:excisionase family DNA binding protein